MKEQIIKKRKENASVGTLFKYLRNHTANEGIGDIPLLKRVLNTLDENSFKYSKREVYNAFRKVDKEDYLQSENYLLMRDLYKNAIEGSIFKYKSHRRK